jgi:hypothetical protein
MNLEFIKKHFTIIKWIIIGFIFFVLYKGYSLTYKETIKSIENGRHALFVWHGIWIILLLILEFHF